MGAEGGIIVEWSSVVIGGSEVVVVGYGGGEVEKYISVCVRVEYN